MENSQYLKVMNIKRRTHIFQNLRRKTARIVIATSDAVTSDEIVVGTCIIRGVGGLQDKLPLVN